MSGPPASTASATTSSAPRRRSSPPACRGASPTVCRSAHDVRPRSDAGKFCAGGRSLDSPGCPARPDSLLAFALVAAAALALAACGGEDAKLLPGETAREITANLDTVQQLSAEGDCVGAESAAAAGRRTDRSAGRRRPEAEAGARRRRGAAGRSDRRLRRIDHRSDRAGGDPVRSRRRRKGAEGEEGKGSRSRRTKKAPKRRNRCRPRRTAKQSRRKRNEPPAEEGPRKRRKPLGRSRPGQPGG